MKRLILFLSIFPLMASSITAQKGDTIIAKQFELKAKELYFADQYDSAANYYKLSAKIYEQQKKWLKCVENYRSEAYCYNKASKTDTALSIIKLTVGLANKYFLNNSKEEMFVMVDTYLTFGDIYAMIGDYEHELLSYQRAISFITESDSLTQLKTADVMDRIGLAYEDLNKLSNAIEFYRKAIVLKQKFLGENHPDLSINYNNLGLLFYSLSEYNQALVYLNKALQIELSNNNADEAMIADYYDNLGTIYSDLGYNDKAIVFQTKALNIRLHKYGENHSSVAGSYNNIGILFMERGFYNKALEYFQRALNIEIFLFGNKYSELSTRYYNLGALYVYMASYDKALDYFQKALQLDLNKYGEHSSYVADIYYNTGILYQKKGDYYKSQNYFQKALQINNQLFDKNHLAIAYCYNAIGEVLYLQNDSKNALSFLNESLKMRIDKVGNNNPDVAYTNNCIGKLYYKEGDYDNALAYYQKALIANLPDFNDTIIFANPKDLDALSKKYFLETLYYKANTLYSLYANSRKSLKDIKTSLEIYDLLFQLIHEMRSDYNHESTQLLLSENTKNYFADAMLAALEYSKLIQDKDVQGKALDYLEKSKSATLSAYLNDLEIKSYLNIADSLVEKEKDIVINRRYYESKIQTAKAEKGGYDTLLVQEYENNLFNYSRQYDSLISALRSEYPEYYKLKYQQQVANINDIREKLDNNTALLNYFVADTSLFIAAITKNQLVYKIVKTDSSFNQKVIDYYIDIKSEFSKKEVASSAILYQYLIEPVEAIVNTKSKLVIIPDGNLNYLPFETLCKDSVYPHDLSDVDYLIKNHTVSYHQSATLWLNSLEKSKKFVAKNNSFIGFAPVFNPEVNNGYIVSNNWATDSTSANMAFRDVSIDLKHFNALPYSEKEIKSIIKLFDKKGKKAAGYFYKEASEKNFKQQSSNYNYIHIASHSFANDRYPALSGIAFSQPDTTNLSENNNDDGILYATETYNLNLSQADLVVLSSCKSGLGKLIKGEGFMSLSRGFLYSGARNLVYSLWNVNDEATMDLMVDFYKQLMHGKDYATALKHAKEKLIKNPATSSPKYWASWVLLGE